MAEETEKKYITNEDLKKHNKSGDLWIAIQGKVYTLGWVCKAHDCGDNQLHVLFAPGAAQPGDC